MYLISNPDFGLKIPKSLFFLGLYLVAGSAGTLINGTSYFFYSAWKLLEMFSALSLGVLLYSYTEKLPEESSKLTYIYLSFLKLLVVAVLLNLIILQRASFTGYMEVGSQSGRLISRFPHISPNELGILAAVIIGIFLSQKSRSLIDWMWFLLALVILVLSKGRAGILAVLVCLVMYSILHRNSLKGIFVFALVFSLIMALRDYIWSYLMRGESVYSIQTLSGRTIYWELGWNAFINGSFIQKLFGHGYAIGVRELVSTYAGETGTSFDNDLLNALLSGGIFGTIFILLLYIRIIVLTFKNYKRCPVVLYVTLIFLIRAATIANLSIFNFLVPFFIVYIVNLEVINSNEDFGFCLRL
ncbi:MAG: O-antigen ligase family protein [Candidatus Hydrothermia bacterium]